MSEDMLAYAVWMLRRSECKDCSQIRGIKVMHIFCKSRDEIGEIRDKYFLDHPEAKAEYEKLYGTEAHVIGKKTVTGKICNLILWGYIVIECSTI